MVACSYKCGYVMSLQDMGIPVAAERGPLGAYRLERGSRLPPLIYNDSEASALVVGLSAMRQLNFLIDAAAVESALAKTIRVLPQRLLCHFNELDDLIKVHNPSYLSATQLLKSDFVWLLEHAIKKRKTTQLTYSAKAGEQSVREVDLYGMVFVAGQWYVSGYCHLREGIRTFRLDRLAAIGTIAYAEQDNNNIAAEIGRWQMFENHYPWLLMIIAIAVITPALLHARKVRQRMRVK